MSILFWRKKEEPTKKYFLIPVPEDKVERFYTLHTNMIMEHGGCLLERYKFWRYVTDTVIPKPLQYARMFLNLNRLLRPHVYVEAGIYDPAPEGYASLDLDETHADLQVFLLVKKEPVDGN